ncbi:MAG: efflux RND transporter periplasmic adaptor subunit [Acidobacteria bacterium]|nr:efflux RND transporter periplasmic adaptor subunit [Acidobacteriota bacterium]
MKYFMLGFLAAAILVSGGFFLYQHRGETGEGGVTGEARYHCPMHPTYTSDHPGDCSICGMKLVPIRDAAGDSGGEAAGEAGKGPAPAGYATVSIPDDRVQMMGITLAEARTLDLTPTIRTSGIVTYDETRIHRVHAKFDGYIEELFVDYTGAYVRKGQPLFSVYSPELYATQNEYLLALRAREQMPGLEPGAPGTPTMDLLAAARQRLRLWDIGAEQIDALERTRMPVRALTLVAPVSGTVIAKTAQQGARVVAGASLYEIVDLGRVWVQADIYERDLPRVRPGQSATLTLPFLPGEIWRGRVTFIDPTVDGATRTVRARLEFSNPGGRLKPEMHADVLVGGMRASGIGVPDSAVVSTGARDIVFVARGEGVFEPREVRLGVSWGPWVEIVEGLSEGERVAAGANFLLDSESRLKAALADAGGHGHGP